MNLKKYKRPFRGKTTPKIKYETLPKDYKAGGLKHDDTPNKIIALQCYNLPSRAKLATVS